MIATGVFRRDSDACFVRDAGSMTKQMTHFEVSSEIEVEGP